jgi:hypothetical protein
MDVKVIKTMSANKTEISKNMSGQSREQVANLTKNGRNTPMSESSVRSTAIPRHR